jgi:hypothetical protein
MIFKRTLYNHREPNQTLCILVDDKGFQECWGTFSFSDDVDNNGEQHQENIGIEYNAGIYRFYIRHLDADCQFMDKEEEYASFSEAWKALPALITECEFDEVKI